MFKKANKYGFDNQVSIGYLSSSFEPLPPMWSRINDIISSKKKRIQFSNKIKNSRDEIKLPNINVQREGSAEEPVKAKKPDSIHTKASMLRTQRIMEKTLMLEMKNNGGYKERNGEFKKKDDFFTNPDGIEVEDIVKLELNDTELKAEEEKNVTQNENEALIQERTYENETKPSDVLSVDDGEGNSSESDSDDNLEQVTDLKREMIKKRFRKAILVNKTLAKLKTNNVLLNLRPNEGDENDPFTDSKNGDDEFDPLSTVKLKFGSSLSEDGNYTMLKCYEDMLCNEIQKIQPKLNTNQIARTKTSAFIRIPRKFNSPVKVNEERKINLNKNLNEENLDKEKLEKVEVKKHKIRVSKQLERAMLITDRIKQKKGQLVTAVKPKSENVHSIVNAYEMWTNSWKKIFV